VRSATICNVVPKRRIEPCSTVNSRTPIADAATNRDLQTSGRWRLISI
jgi:hypothetical protein